MAAKKKLATLLGGLQQDRTEHSERATKVCLNFVEIDGGFTTNACFQTWSSWAKRAKEAPKGLGSSCSNSFRMEF